MNYLKDYENYTNNTDDAQEGAMTLPTFAMYIFFMPLATLLGVFSLFMYAKNKKLFK